MNTDDLKPGDRVLWPVEATDIMASDVEIEWVSGDDSGHMVVDAESLTTEAAIRADERARIVAHIDRRSAHLDGPELAALRQVAGEIERGEYNK